MDLTLASEVRPDTFARMVSMHRRPSSRDVARLANVSQTTVSFVLNRREGANISEETRARVEKAAAELGYRPNRLADALLRNKSYTVCCVTPSRLSTYHAGVVEGIDNYLSARGYRLLSVYTHHDPVREAEQVHAFLDSAVDGIVYFADEVTLEFVDNWLSRAIESNVACLVVDTRSRPGLDAVVSDDVNGSRQVTDHLISLGHERIGHLGAGHVMSTAVDRLEGYRIAMKEAQLPIDESWVIGNSYLSLPSDQEIFDLACRVTAITAAADDSAGKVLQVLKERGVRVPEDCSVTGFGNQEWTPWVGLTTVVQHTQEMGISAGQLLLQRMGELSAPPQLRTFATDTVIRQSTAPPRPPDSAHRMPCLI